MGVTETFGILLDWDPQVVSLLVEQSNLNLDGRPEAPQWFQLNQTTGKTSTNMLITSIVDHMMEKMGSSTSNKSFGRVLIARHTWSQFWARHRSIEIYRKRSLHAIYNEGCCAKCCFS